MNNWKRKLANEDESAAKKQKMITLEVEFEWSINGVLEEMMDCGKVDTDAVPAILYGQP